MRLMIILVSNLTKKKISCDIICFYYDDIIIW